MKVLARSAVVLLGTLLGALPLRAAPDPTPAGQPGGQGATGATPGRAAVLPVEISPAMASAVADRFRASVEAGLILAIVPVVASADTDQQRLATVGECRTPDCQSRLAAGLKAEYVVSPYVSRSGKNYKLRLALHDPKGVVSLERTDTCDICTLSEVVAKIRGLGQTTGAELRRRLALLPRPEPPRRKVVPRREPPRREVRVTPPHRPPTRPPGPKIVPPRPKPRPKPSIRQAAWMSATMGLVSFVGGVTLLALDGGYTCDKQPARLQCPYRYDTGTAGAVFTALGGAAMVAGGVLFYYAYFRKPKSSERPRATLGVAPTRGGAFAQAEVRF